jgi:hypothetical protein
MIGHVANLGGEICRLSEGAPKITNVLAGIRSAAAIDVVSECVYAPFVNSYPSCASADGCNAPHKR